MLVHLLLDCCIFLSGRTLTLGVRLAAIAAHQKSDEVPLGRHHLVSVMELDA